MIANLLAIGLTILLWPVIGPWALLCIVFYKVIAMAVVAPIAATAAGIEVATEKLRRPTSADAGGASPSTGALTVTGNAGAQVNTGRTTSIGAHDAVLLEKGMRDSNVPVDEAWDTVAEAIQEVVCELDLPEHAAAIDRAVGVLSSEHRQAVAARYHTLWVREAAVQHVRGQLGVSSTDSDQPSPAECRLAMYAAISADTYIPEPVVAYLALLDTGGSEVLSRVELARTYYETLSQYDKTEDADFLRLQCNVAKAELLARTGMSLAELDEALAQAEGRS